MSRVFQEVRIRSNIGESAVKALFDTGASRTFIKNEVAKRIGYAIKLLKPRVVTLGDGDTKIEVKENINLEIILDDYAISTDADVTEKLAHELIIGASTMEEWGIVVDPKEGKVLIKERRTSFELV